jgi:hypothetical protein
MNVDRDFMGPASHILHAIFYLFFFLVPDMFSETSIDLQGNSRRDITEDRTLRNSYEVHIK